uniref:Uncharacterized protein n=1 Tax=Romanomermis culicivorax TaxID=13658 RepID=A0A915JTX8_ROMCU
MTKEENEMSKGIDIAGFNKGSAIPKNRFMHKISKDNQLCQCVDNNDSIHINEKKSSSDTKYSNKSKAKR